MLKGRVSVSVCNAVQSEPVDNVVVVIETIAAGETISYCKNNEVKRINAIEDIPIYHKVAVRDISRGETIVKYGEAIGLAACRITQGSCVHINNTESFRGTPIKVEV